MNSVHKWRIGRPGRPSISGFTLIELVMIMVLTGIIAVVAVPRMVEKITFNTRGFADQVRAAIQYAQKVAIAQRRNVCVVISSGTLTVTRAAAAGSGVACTVAVANPAGGSSYSFSAPSGVSLGASSSPITYDALGSTAAAVTVTITGDQTITFAIEQGTGYVH
ncbi:MAG: GspH/FimT family pseudopilin [Betaproteobacteria bacterium]